MLWKIDPVHSSIEFGVRHLGISHVRGRFGAFEGDIHTDDVGLPSLVEATIKAASIDTNNAQRDGHLRSPEILDADNHPDIVFRSTSITAGTPNETNLQHYDVVGDLTIRGVTKPVHMKASVTSPITDHMGGTRVAAEIQGHLKRTDWGIELSHNPLFNNALLVGEEVYFHFHLQAVQSA